MISRTCLLSVAPTVCSMPSQLPHFKTLSPPVSRRRFSLPMSSIIRAISSPAISEPAANAAFNGEKGAVTPRPQWKAAIDLKWIRDNKDLVATNIRNRNSTANLELVLELYEDFCNLQKEVERMRGERNVVANKMKGRLEPSVRQSLVEEGKNLKEALAALEDDLVVLTDKLQLEAQCIPNITHPDVPTGGEENSVVRHTVGNPTEFKFTAKDHIQLGKELDLFDFDSAAEVFR